MSTAKKCFHQETTKGTGWMGIEVIINNKISH